MATIAAARPTVSVYKQDDSNKPSTTVPLPDVFTSPIRPDVINFVHTQVRKNSRQAYSVKYDAGMETAAESWGTGRAVSRIPRVPGGGTHRAGQGAFGNMCRGGRMFAPTRIWRKWHRKISKGQKRYAVSSALAASAVPALVMARGHRVNNVPEMPLVITGADGIKKTKEAVKILKEFGLEEEIQKVKDSKKVRAGRGKARNRRYVMRRGPLIVHDEDSKTAGLRLAFKGIAGVELAHVDRLNLLQLAPGGHVGRLIIWTESAFAKLNTVFGTITTPSTEKRGFVLPRPLMMNADLARIINSDEVQTAINDPKEPAFLPVKKINPLRNAKAMQKLNPYANTMKRKIIDFQNDADKRKKAKAETAKAKKDSTRTTRTAFYKKMVAE